MATWASVVLDGGRETRKMTGDATTERTDLSDLLRSRKEELGKSYRDLEAACIDPQKQEAGPLYRRGTLENLVKAVPGTKAPSFQQLRALAAGFQLPLGRVQDAAGAQFFGIDTVWSEDEQVRALVHDFREMSPQDQEWVRAIVQSRRDVGRG
jgi:hypothetical protein